MTKNKTESTAEEDEGEIYLDSEDSAGEDYEYDCIRCGENYFKTKKIEDWIQCIFCLKWMHENYTPFESTCDTCGKKARGKAKGKGRRNNMAIFYDLLWPSDTDRLDKMATYYFIL